LGNGLQIVEAQGVKGSKKMRLYALKLLETPLQPSFVLNIKLVKDHS
jgi:hypothetical protein